MVFLSYKLCLFFTESPTRFLVRFSLFIPFYSFGSFSPALFIFYEKILFFPSREYGLLYFRGVPLKGLFFFFSASVRELQLYVSDYTIFLYPITAVTSSKGASWTSILVIAFAVEVVIKTVKFGRHIILKFWFRRSRLFFSAFL